MTAEYIPAQTSLHQKIIRQNPQQMRGALPPVCRPLWVYGMLMIQVKDMGVGIDTRESTSASHFGLFRIQERAESFGGRLEVVSQPEKGTCVSIILPSH